MRQLHLNPTAWKGARHFVHIFILTWLNLNWCQNLMVFHQNIDGNIKFRYSLIIINHQIDEKHHILTSIESLACQSDFMDPMPHPLHWPIGTWTIGADFKWVGLLPKQCSDFYRILREILRFYNSLWEFTKLTTFHKISVVWHYAFIKFWSTLLTFGFAFGTFGRWLQNFSFICTELKFWIFELCDGESSKSQYSSYLFYAPNASPPTLAI